MFVFKHKHARELGTHHFVLFLAHLVDARLVPDLDGQVLGLEDPVLLLESVGHLRLVVKNLWSVSSSLTPVLHATRKFN